MKKFSFGLLLVSLLLVSVNPVFAGEKQKKTNAQNPQVAKPNYVLVIAIISEAGSTNGGVATHMIEIQNFTSSQKCEEAGKKAREYLSADGTFTKVSSVCFEK